MRHSNFGKRLLCICSQKILSLKSEQIVNFKQQHCETELLLIITFRLLNMKGKLIIILLLIFNNTFGQNNTILDESSDCITITLNAVNKINELFKSNQLDSFAVIKNNWVKTCGVSECTQRLIILNNIMSNVPSEESIKVYIENDFQYRYSNRFYASSSIDFGYIYSNDKQFYSNVPLRHSIDSTTKFLSKKLLNSNNITLDERLICILFSDGPSEFEKALKNKKFNHSFVKQFLLRKIRNTANSEGTITISTGICRPINPNDVFGYNQTLGLSVNSPFKNKLNIELGMKYRLNINDKSFKYFALEDTINVNSAYSLILGVLIGYKVYETKKLSLIPKFGIAFESIEFGLPNYVQNPDKKTFNISTFQLSIGLTAMKPIFRRNYIGLGISYHYSPYQLDKNLVTKIGNNLLSTELIFRL